MAAGGFNLSGKTALVTGGSKGLGKAMARGLAEAGADVVISSRHEDELRAALDDILRGLDRRGAFVVADMARRDDVVRLAKEALELNGRIDVLINNAGTNRPEAIDAVTDKNWDEVLEINLSSVMALTRALVPQMKARGWGRIIHIASVLAFLSKEKRNGYSATKAALLGLGPRQRPRPRPVRRDRQLHRPRPVPHRPADVDPVGGGEEGVRRPHGRRPLGRSEGDGRPRPAAGQRRRQLHHRPDAGGGRRLSRALRPLPPLPGFPVSPAPPESPGRIARQTDLHLLE